MSLGVSTTELAAANQTARERVVDLRLSDHCVALLGEHNGKYPDANGILVTGNQRTALIEPTLGVRLRLENDLMAPLEASDLVLLSHCHEDHIPALPLLPDTECWVHRLDHGGFEDLESFLDLFGYPGAERERFASLAVERFHFAPRPQAQAFEDGDTWDLGGVTITARHAPGHTPGHCFFFIEPDGVAYLGDVDLSSFGPYYADVESSVDAFVSTLIAARDVDARWYVTGHHKGAVEGRRSYLHLLDRYAAMIPRREADLVSFLKRPRTLEEIVARRFIYRPHDRGSLIDHVEGVSAQLHLARLLRSGAVRQLASGRSQREATRYVAPEK